MHVIKKAIVPYRMPKISNAHLLKKKKIKINERPFILMYKNNSKDVGAILSLARCLEPLGIVHIGLTPKNSVLYVKLKISLKSIDKIEKVMRECLSLVHIKMVKVK
ncbi:hypothetical protein JCM12298_24920 [Desulfothermus naphthae]